MVEAELVYWKMGRRRRGLSCMWERPSWGILRGNAIWGFLTCKLTPPNPKEAVKWLYLASCAGYVRSQYQLALCLHQGRGCGRNLSEAAGWCLRAAEGGYVRAMYNTSLCYSSGEGLVQSHRLARKWMKKAADRGHSEGQREHGYGLFSEGEKVKAVVYLELATQAGETAAAAHVKNVIVQQLSALDCDRALRLADNWPALPSSHWMIQY